ncbi:hypothetical protein ACFQV2_20490 [Actinokineospora soli]|uniref:HEAT repeat-containing protein n=1 Tax=Actinokineospora soli TaxID=1048753 RepID=A0ABW2TP02_9PSEU
MVDKVAENNRGVTMGQLIRAVAHTDLPRAERLAATIADPGTRAYAFATVVTAALPLDRQLAHRAAAEAHAAAASLVPDEGFEASNVQRAIQAIALIDIAAAERLADTMTDNAWGLAAAAMAVAPHDPDRAQAIAARIPRTDRSSTAFAELATALADNHPHQALRVAAAIPREQDRNRALRDIAAALALHDPSQSERTADRITDPATKSRAMVLIATRWLDNT